MVIEAEVSGRWSDEGRTFLGTKARSAPLLLRHSVQAARLHQWRCLLACTAARNFALSLLDTAAPGVHGDVPSMQDVLSEGRYFLWGLRLTDNPLFGKKRKRISGLEEEAILAQGLKASIAHACFAVCSLCLLFEFLLHLCQPTHLMGRKGWSQMEVPSGWLQVIRGPRPRSQQWPSAKTNVQTMQREVPGRWRQFKGVIGNPQGRKLSPEAAREIAQSSVTRL